MNGGYYNRPAPRGKRAWFVSAALGRSTGRVDMRLVSGYRLVVGQR